jgi:hypothetical protein
LLRSVRISALALLKMAMHAKSGGNIEVMGVMQVRTVLHGCRLLRLPYSAAPNTVSSPPSQPLCTCTNGLQGKIQGGEFIVIDSFALPVEGTETRVNAQAEAFEYMVDFLETNQVGFVSAAQLGAYRPRECVLHRVVCTAFQSVYALSRGRVEKCTGVAGVGACASEGSGSASTSG